MLVIGLAGGIATGKTELAKRWAEHGAQVLEADKVARELVKKGSLLGRRISETFGPEVVDSKGNLDRQQLGRIVFENIQRRQDLNRLMHPEMVAEIKTQLQTLAERDEPVVVVEAAILEEMGLLPVIDKLVVTTCSPQKQLERLKAKGLDEQAAQLRINAQTGLTSLQERADWIVSTEGDLSDLTAQAEILWQEFLKDHGPTHQPQEVRQGE